MISLCRYCYCMTKTVRGKCGKCGTSKRVTKFSIGNMWRCDRPDHPRGSFNFLVVGPGSRPGHKLCRLIPDDPQADAYPGQWNGKYIEQEYPHAHLKRYAKHKGIRG